MEPGPTLAIVDKTTNGYRMLVVYRDGSGINHAGEHTQLVDAIRDAQTAFDDPLRWTDDERYGVWVGVTS